MIVEPPRPDGHPSVGGESPQPRPPRQAAPATPPEEGNNPATNSPPMGGIPSSYSHPVGGMPSSYSPPSEGCPAGAGWYPKGGVPL